MVKKERLCCLLVVALILALSLTTVEGAALVTLKIRAINPSKTEKQKVSVKSYLPKAVKPADIVSAGDLEVSYDVSAGAYVVTKDVELDPTNSRTFEVSIKDIWEIPEATIKELTGHAEKLSLALKDSDKADTAAGYKALIDEGLKGVLARQAATAVGTVKPVDHIRAYESNQEVLDRIRKDVGVLENLVIGAGKDLDTILGEPKIPPALDSGDPGATGSVVIIHVKITNPSLTEKKKVPLMHEFPSEVKTTDVVDAGGLQIGFDATRNVSYAYLDDIELGPQESRVFDVKIKDPWAALVERLPRLEKRCQDILVITKDLESYKAVTAQATGLLKELDELKGKKGPGLVNQEYVAFARQQAGQVHGIEMRIQRLEEFFQPHEKPMKNGIPVMDVPRPDKQTTWVLIYVILGFLGVFSALFFLRWYGKGKAEKEEQPGRTSADQK